MNCVYRDQARPGGLTAEEITRLGLIVPRSPLGWDADGKSRIAGDVNMELYAQWLKQNYGLTLGGS